MKCSSLHSHLRSARPVFLFFIFLLTFRIGFADWSPIPSGSMEPTLFRVTWCG